jgi:hypothetical protein
LHGESKELKDEVVGLAREHGVVTPYTAYLIMEDETKRNVPIAARCFRSWSWMAVPSARPRTTTTPRVWIRIG